jgi:hypothetical protein
MEYVAIYAERVKGNLQSMASLGQIFLRPILNGKIGNSFEDTEYGRMPLIWTGVVPHKIISQPLRHNDEIALPSKISSLKDYVLNEIEETKKETKFQLAKTKDGTKKQHDLEEKIALAETAVANSTNSFNLEFSKDSRNGATYYLTLPPIKKSIQELYLSRFFSIISPHNSPSMSIQRHLDMPYSIIKIDEEGKISITGKKPSYDMIKETGILSLDAETHNWEKIDISAELKELQHGDIALLYLESIGLNSRDFNETAVQDALKIPKRELIRRIEQNVNINRGEMLTLITLNSHNYTGLVSVFKDSKENYTFEDPITGVNCEVPVTIIPVTLDIGSEVAKIISEQDPLVITGHNHSKFDLKKIRELSEDSFPIGTDDSNPKVKHSLPGGFIEIYDVTGRDSIDPAFYFMFHEKTWSNNLDEVTMFLHQQSKLKGMSHAQLSISTDNALQGDLDEIRSISDYGWSDGQKSLHNGISLLREIYATALLYRSRMIDVSTTSHKSLSYDFWSSDMFERGLFPHFNPAFHSFNKMNLSSDSNYLFVGMENNGLIPYSMFDRGRMLERIISKISDKNDKALGTHDAILLSINPYLHALKNLFSRIPQIEETYEISKFLDDNHSKARLLNHIENVLELPLFDIIAESRNAFRRREEKINADSEAKFKERYGLELSLKEITDIVHDEYRKLYSVLGKERILSLKDNYIIIPKETDLNIDSINALFISEGKVHIAAPHKFVYRSDSRTIASGISNPKQNKGLKSQFEKETMSVFYERLFNHCAFEALSYLHERIGKAIEGKIDENDHIYEKKASKNYHDYSSNARGKIIQAHTDNRTMKGEKSRVHFDNENLKKKLAERFSPLVTMTLGHDAELIKLRKRILLGEITPLEMELIRTRL